MLRQTASEKVWSRPGHGGGSSRGGAGAGTFVPAAKVAVEGGAFVVEDYSGEVVKLSGVTRK